MPISAPTAVVAATATAKPADSRVAPSPTAPPAWRLIAHGTTSSDATGAEQARLLGPPRWVLRLMQPANVSVAEGATWIDGSLRGLGAGAGNSPTEVLAATFDHLGVATGVDVGRLSTQHFSQRRTALDGDHHAREEARERFQGGALGEFAERVDGQIEIVERSRGLPHVLEQLFLWNAG